METFTTRLTMLPKFAQGFINHLSVTNKSKTTQYGYIGDILDFFTFLSDYLSGFPKDVTQFTPEIMAKITHKDIEAYLSSCQTSRDNTPRTRARKQATIKSLYKYMVRDDLLVVDVTVKLDPIKIGRKIQKSLEPNEIAVLAENIEPADSLTKNQQYYHAYTWKRDHAVMLTLIGTGLRLSELRSITLNDINFQKGSIFVLRKGNKEANVYFSKEVAMSLHDYIDNERPRYAQKTGNTIDLFLNIQGNKLGNHGIASIVKKYMEVLKSMGYNVEGFTTHKMRSTFATLLLRETNSLALVQDALGHQDPKTTRIYTKVLDEELQQAANLIKFK